MLTDGQDAYVQHVTVEGAHCTLSLISGHVLKFEMALGQATSNLMMMMIRVWE